MTFYSKIGILFFSFSGIILLLSPAQGTGAPLIDTPTKIAIDPGRVKERIKNIPKPLKSIEPKIIKKTAKKKKDKIAQKSSEKSDIKFKLTEVTITGASVYSKKELFKHYQSFLNKKVSLSDLQTIAQNITDLYRKDGYVISKAIIPPQKIDSGNAIIHVIEGYIAEVYIEPKGKINKVRKQIDKYAEKIKEIRPLQTKKLERYILLLNDIPGLTVKTIISPSTSTAGAADITLLVRQKRFSGEIYYDNRGSIYMGPDQLITSIAAKDIITAADEITIQNILTPRHRELRYIQLGYSLPTDTSGLRIGIDGSFTVTRPGGPTLEEFDLLGRSKSFGINIDWPLIRSRKKNLWLSGEIDWLDTRTNNDGSILFEDKIRSVRVGASFDFIDSWRGGNLIDIKLSKGLKIFGASDLLNPNLSRQKGRSDYTKINVNLQRHQLIKQNLSLMGTINTQYSFNNPLLSAEEFSFGGSQFGRAYDSSELVGDSGIIGKLELQFNTYPYWKFLQQIQYYSFYDAGIIWNAGENIDNNQPTKDSGTNLGIGLRTTFNSYFYGNIEIAKPLTRDVAAQIATGKNGKAWRLFFGLGVSL